MRSVKKPDSPKKHFVRKQRPSTQHPNPPANVIIKTGGDLRLSDNKLRPTYPVKSFIISGQLTAAASVSGSSKLSVPLSEMIPVF